MKYKIPTFNKKIKVSAFKKKPHNFCHWYGRLRRGQVLRIATPKFANKQKIKEIYKRCREITLETGIQHHVDHIIPIKSTIVCGLHTETNLRIVTATENLTRKKGDYYEK